MVSVAVIDGVAGVNAVTPPLSYLTTMQILIHSSNLKEILQCYETGLVDGIDYPYAIYTDSDIDCLYGMYDAIEGIDVDREVHIPLGGTVEQMTEKADKILSTHAYGAVLKIPVNRGNLKLARNLAHRHYRINVTHVYNPAQAVMVAKSGVDNVTVSVGAIDDFGYAGLEVLRGVAGMCSAQKVDTTVVANDLRTTHRASRAIYNGASTIVLEPKVFWEMYRHPLSHTNSGWASPVVETYVDDELSDLFQ